MTYNEKYHLWINSNFIDEETKKELIDIKKDEKEIEDRFYKDLQFGTGGLRGVIGAGSNRMNIYTVGKSTEGLSRYLINNKGKGASVSIAYDSRNKSKEFAEAAARVLCGNGIKVNLFEDLRPTPMLSFTVRHLKSSAGIVITASHNPKEYNGYKVYGEDGGQITDRVAEEIISEINAVKDFSEIKFMDLEEAKEKGLLSIIGEEVDKAYIDKVKELSIRKALIREKADELKIIYTPIHGSGNKPVRRVLKELGYDKVYTVKEQENPDGNFPTVEYPNPEDAKVFDIALKMAEDIEPDIIFGTDPDCDRIGVVVKNKEGKYKVLTGNQTGALLMEYILSSLKEENKLPKNGVVIKTIVTTEIAREIAKEYNVEIIDVLTGFKYIGEKMKEFEEKGDKKYIFGFEESYGYLTGDFVRDKDAVITSMLISEMTLYYKTKGMTLYDALQELYNKYGFYKEELVSITLKGKEGQEKIENLMEHLRHSMKAHLDQVKIVKKFDYKLGIQKDLVEINEEKIDLPKSNVLKFILEDNSCFVVRPSGTEPKIKIYLSVVGNSSENCKDKMIKFKEQVMSLID
ncbi:phospho-sugar mutase [Haloimpatiens lingqiaonensis]|uniref:phospho-sugar mutase n=1 Tax=Haloimpatiens lingqiaonensis TaxID=1380675 RepID=UPI0010FD6892|nr:phospho-sugar mutase [Haloimpatiens lingqiaonensis]